MIRCNVCNIEKEQSQFQTYWHSSQNKFRTRKECTTCFYNKRNLRRKKIKMEQVPIEQEIIQPTPILTPTIQFIEEPVVPEIPELSNVEIARLQVDYRTGEDENEGREGYRVCRICNHWKLKVGNFYPSGPKHYHVYCIPCAKVYEQVREKKQQEKLRAEAIDDGSREKVLRKPNTYVDDYQRKCTFDIMQAIGWTFNEENGKWFKDGIKTRDGIFIKIQERREQAKLKIKKVTRYKGRPRSKIWDRADEMVKLRQEGLSWEELAKLFNASSVTIRYIVNFKNEEAAASKDR